MPYHDRRSILSGLAAAGGMLALTGTSLAAAEPMRSVRTDPVFLVPPFQLGIASGDPDAEGFVIWTRLAPEPLQANGGMTMVPVLVSWEVSSDEGFRTIVAAGEAIAHPELAHSVHVEVAGLRPDRPYWYRFRCGREQSLSGRSRTLPLPGAPKDRVRFAVAGCQHYEEGHYTAWRRIAEEPIDFVFHYGDYIYEGRETGPGPRLMNGRHFAPLRRHVGDEIHSLDDYRRRYALYKTDHDLQAAHAAAPWFVSFDDHEIDNNWAAGHDQDGTPPEIFAFRRAMAMQAYYEHMPLRRSSMPVNGHMQMFRRARFGNLIDAHFLDARQYRSDQVHGGRDSPLDAQVAAPDRSMLGDLQEKWLFEGLAEGRARWQLVAQQVMLMMLAQRRPGTAEPSYSMDVWSGYLHSRRRLLRHIADRRMTNVVTVSGDAHRHFAGNLIQDQGDGAIIASEFLATSITSGSDGIGQADAYHEAVKDNPCLKTVIDRRGYLLCDVDHRTWRGELKILDSVMRPDGALSTFAAFVAEPGEPGLKQGA
jgi:alkaline phosphatase D